MTVSENEVFDRALKKFGIEKQMVKCVEELAELQKELCKQSLGQGSMPKIIEEMADVEIMLDQTRIGLNIGFYELNQVRVDKVKRLNDMLRKKDQEEKPQTAAAIGGCAQCAYKIMTREQIIEHGEDPCKLCDKYRGWLQKG